MSTDITLTQEGIDALVKRITKESEGNRMRFIDNSPIFEEPLVGFASGDDPLFAEYKTIIGDYHMTPAEALQKATGKEAESVSVISWVLPLATKIKASMRREKTTPTKIWAHGMHYAPRFNDVLRAQMVDYLQRQGYAAVAPYTAAFWRRIVTPTDQSSNWSERHVAYAAGLGTFSHNDGLITPKGMAMFCGSVVTDLALPASPREYTSHTAYCPYVLNGSCGRCIERCPSGAITEKGHDKIKCFDFRAQFTHLAKPYEIERVTCGFCLTAVPCESAIPTGLLKGSS
ncbi:MAG: epoxyqueuosine reductase [Chloroflexi bacterium]|nr:epoxyqueuosine reductase [Chloroflexota bacterium]